MCHRHFYCGKNKMAPAMPMPFYRKKNGEKGLLVTLQFFTMSVN